MQRSIFFAALFVSALSLTAGEPTAPNAAELAKKAQEEMFERMRKEKELIDLKRVERLQAEREAAAKAKDALQAKPGEAMPRDPRDEGRRPEMPKLHAKFADGTEIDIDAPMLNMPGTGQLLDRITDPAKDGILTFNLARDFEPGLNLEKLKEAVARVIPHVSLEVVWVGQGLLVATSESIPELRKAQAILRAMKPQMEMPHGPQPGGERMRPRPDGEQPKRERKEEPPGQF